MSRMVRWGGRLAAAAVGAALGASVMLAANSLGDSEDTKTRPPGRISSPPAISASSSPSPHGLSKSKLRAAIRPRGTVLVWAPLGTPPNSERAIERIAGVRAATTVRAGLDWLIRSRSPDGVVVDRAPRGFAIPFETAIVDLDYAGFVAPAERDDILALRHGEVLLAETAAELRRARPGSVIQFRDRTVRVAGIVSDVATNGYEAIARAPMPAWERVDTFVLAAGPPSVRRKIEQRIKSQLQPGQRLRFRVADEQPFQRYGDAVHPQMIIKKHFGEFAARPLPSGHLQIEGSWLKRNLRRARVPILGEVVCHKALLPQLTQALRTISDRGMAHMVDRSSFGGCFGPRFIDLNPDGRISHHSWGIAFDINVKQNAFGREPNLDPRLVRAIEQWGFTWGGRWIIPDGMHFEWQRWP
ncbi:MAG: M15 family metallopeptidase [Actinomycetota bacterium]